MANLSMHDDNVMSFLFGQYLYRNLTPEKLEQYGIHRGASDDSDDYSMEGKLTPEGAIKKMKEMFSALPQNMQDVLTPFFNQKTELDDIIQANAEIQKAMALSRASNPREDGSDVYMPSAAPQDDAFWNQFDSSLVDINESYNKGHINIEDIVDY